MTSHHLTLRDALLALAIVLVWGTNFVVIRLGLNALPPLFFATLRFTFVLLPAVFFLPRPKVPWSNLAAYGVCIGLLQFGILFIAMNGHISPGLASLVVQMQVFFTIALTGMAVIVTHNGHGTTALGLSLVLVAAMGWALANQASREAARDGQQLNMLAYVVWAAMFSVPPLLALSLLLEGPAAIAHGISQATAVTWVAVLWQSVGNTMFGYACWAWLLSRYPAATIAPMSLLVPVFGFAASAAILGEPLPMWKLEATALIMGGLAVNLLWRPRRIQLAGEPD
jgi:O-acetylserine/cysteine efflux transporter